jgi:methionyl-tRNA formyltransferase
VLGVVTQPDRPAGRGMKLEAPIVKKIALEHALPIWQPEKINNEATYAWLKERGPEILVVVAFGAFLGEKLLRFCSHPPINVHPSLLPDLRGAAPMQWAVLRGYKKTGVTTQFMAKAMDAGDVLLQAQADIGENETAGELSERLKLVGGDLLVKTLTAIEAGKITPTPQNEANATFAPMLTKEQGLIAWQEKEAKEIHYQACGLHPWPGAYSMAAGKRVKILRTHLPKEAVFRSQSLKPGEFYVSGDSIFVRCKSACLEIREVQPEGRRPMLPREFVNGMKAGFSDETIFSFDGV